MHVYNTIVVLKEILPVFPIAKVYDYSGIMVWKAVEKLLEHEQRNDLKILANAYVFLYINCSVSVLTLDHKISVKLG